MGGDLAIRQGPWKLIFLKNGRRELYHLGSDLGETKDVAAVHPKMVGSLTVLMEKYIGEGRSTAGAPQKNEAEISLDGSTGGNKKRGKKEKEPSPKEKEEEARSLDPNFD